MLADQAGALAAGVLCWVPLVSVVGGLIVAFFYTNRVAFARELYDSDKQYAGGAHDEGYKGWRWN